MDVSAGGGAAAALICEQDSVSKPRTHIFISSRYNSPVCAQLPFHDSRHLRGLAAATAEGRGLPPPKPKTGCLISPCGGSKALCFSSGRSLTAPSNSAPPPLK